MGKKLERNNKRNHRKHKIKGKKTRKKIRRKTRKKIRRKKIGRRKRTTRKYWKLMMNIQSGGDDEEKRQIPECLICYDSNKESLLAMHPKEVKEQPKHYICKKCFSKWYRNLPFNDERRNQCFLCREDITERIETILLTDDVVNTFTQQEKEKKRKKKRAEILKNVSNGIYKEKVGLNNHEYYGLCCTDCKKTFIDRCIGRCFHRPGYCKPCKYDKEEEVYKIVTNAYGLNEEKQCLKVEEVPPDLRYNEWSIDYEPFRWED